eukprot:760972-Hanusia_phi.AAC.1
MGVYLSSFSLPPPASYLSYEASSWSPSRATGRASRPPRRATERSMSRRSLTPVAASTHRSRRRPALPCWRRSRPGCLPCVAKARSGLQGRVFLRSRAAPVAARPSAANGSRRSFCTPT